MHRSKAQISMTRRRLLIAGRVGLLGLSGTAFVAAARSSTSPLVSEATQKKGKNRKGKQHHQSHQKPKGRQKKGNKQNGQQGNQPADTSGDIQLSTGSILPASLIAEEGGQYSAHLLLPFQTFSSSAELADAVAEAEAMQLFVLPSESQLSEARVSIARLEEQHKHHGPGKKSRSHRRH